MRNDFRTVVETDNYGIHMGVQSPVLLMGSCFAENIGEMFLQARLEAMINPTGIVYNPVSLAHSLELLINADIINEDEVLENNGVWHHFDFHGRFSDTNKMNALKKMNESIAEGHEFLKKSHFLILTLGSSYVYKYKELNRIVANCHKFPDKLFTRYRLSVDRMVETQDRLLAQLKRFNPRLNVIYTVSPIRHWRDNAHGNQLSKSALFLAIDQICEKWPNAVYFPSYEIVMDELRDYRFYDESMLHPSKLAVKYIWSRFIDTFMTPDVKRYIKLAGKVAAARQHRFMGAKTTGFYEFVNKNLEMIDAISKEFSVSLLDDDRAYFHKLLKNSV